MSQVNIRRIQLYELELVKEFIQLVFSDYEYPETIARTIDGIDDNYHGSSFLYHGAFLENQLKGIVIGWPNGTLTIQAIAVSEESRRKGIGSRLLKAFEDAARDHGYEKYALGAVWEAVPFYLANGLECFANVNLKVDAIDKVQLRDFASRYDVLSSYVFGNPPDAKVKKVLQDVLSCQVNEVFTGWSGISLQVKVEEITKELADQMEKDIDAINVQYAFRKNL